MTDGIAPLEYSPDDPKTFMMPLLTSFPNPRQLETRVPLPKAERIIPTWSQEAWDMGYRLHPELATKFVIPGDQPGMGWMNPPKVVEKDEYDKWYETSKKEAKSTLEDLLSSIDPKAAQRISDMSDEERAAALAAEKPKAAQALANLQKLGLFAGEMADVESKKPDEAQ